ncbi:F-box protein [Ralstonia syzygii]|uniref:F-box protein n=1 Tax=Ralstonia solanacearum species complex TaxID=3116862 RepID=UPI000E57FBF1|nr:GALA protein [Ralstonia solanacearum]AXV91210.1 GALA protein [Ralstonia solanacearum]AXW20610.1 GALA protein [Ralstonia solanacearum]AXW76117.1 GALA protein [Ralstonia solanacearum]
MVKRTSTDPYVRPAPSAPPLPEGGFEAAPNQGGGQQAYSPSRSSAGVASSPLGVLASLRLGAGPAGTSSMQRRQLPPTAFPPPPKMENVQQLPDGALQHIASFLDPRSRRALSRVSHIMNEAARSSQTSMQAWNKSMLNQLHHYPNLQGLRLLGNITLDELKALPSTLPHLRHLDLGECTGEAKSPAAIEYLATLPLESLNVKGAQIGDHGAQLLAANLSLKKLNVADGGISEVGAKTLAAHPSLESLDMSGNRIDARGAAHLATSQSIQTLRLCCCGVTDSGIQALARNNRLASLDVSGNHIGDDALRALATSSSLTSLDVGYNRLHAATGRPQTAAQGEGMAFALAGGLAGRTTPLASLKADGNSFNDFAVQMLALSSIRTASLSLKSNLIGPAGARKLAENPALESLDLTQNKIGDEGAQALAGSQSLRNITVLNCFVKDVGAQALARSRTLASLDLGNLISATGNEAEQAGFDRTANEITAIGARALAQSPSLISLSVQGNLCGDAGVLELARSRKLSTLNVAFTNMGPESAKELARNPVLTSLNVRWNYHMGTQGALELAKSRSLVSLDARDASIGKAGALALEANTRITGTPEDPNFLRESYGQD